MSAPVVVNQRRKGIAVILTTLSMFVIVPMVGLGIDVSTLYIVRAKMYEAADAAGIEDCDPRSSHVGPGPRGMPPRGPATPDRFRGSRSTRRSGALARLAVRAVSGTAAPPSSVMNSRRLIRRSPASQDYTLAHGCNERCYASQQNGSVDVGRVTDNRSTREPECGVATLNNTIAMTARVA
jgi:hypothetical protein